MTEPQWTLVIHGGAGKITPDKMKPGQEDAIRAALHRALDAGAAILERGGAALDAVEAAVRVLEDDPNFNAGRGAALSYDGVAELDAAIMDGRTRDAGAVARVTTTRNPVSLARAVMDNGRHVFLAGIGADAFSQSSGVEQVDNDWFITPERRANLIELKADNADAYDVDMKYGTVGAVARDRHGHVAAATSTGGVTGKRWGRIGDTPVIGAGTYADDRAGAVSATGSGEFFIRENVGHEICARVRLGGVDIASAARAVMADVKDMGGSGGVIVVSPQGDASWSFNTPGMYRARVSSISARVIGIFGE
ncbi:isoaspartyl peptidase/L-asparaginase family protein [Sphingomonas sp. SUN039]|uniref:isoaspartyl peptidase/L-asparaginase family protein n=1 Tax=Sphingomonas sp. SUN039 TaxID=2937787 RepID=UPI002164770A|nr:isoaspartyl peptidase/L-asparaginase [Sphingomonas sp. SUN039]UVO55555.1 isoaspartyl peptidase/L-asparaginase [Sphingomonas sp. SUN039]